MIINRKNRRDGATVSTRVLALADKVGRDLFASATIQENQIEESTTSSKKRRRKEIQTRAKL